MQKKPELRSAAPVLRHSAKRSDFGLLFFDVEGIFCGAQGPFEPEGAAQAVWAGSGSGHSEPLFVVFGRAFGIDEDVAVLVVWTGALDADPLVPAVHAADGVGVHSVGDVLMDPAIAPEDAL